MKTLTTNWKFQVGFIIPYSGNIHFSYRNLIPGNCFIEEVVGITSSWVPCMVREVLSQPYNN